MRALQRRRAQIRPLRSLADGSLWRLTQRSDPSAACQCARVYVEISELCARGVQSGSHTNPSSGRGELRAARGPVRGRNAESFEEYISGLR